METKKKINKFNVYDHYCERESWTCILCDEEIECNEQVQSTFSLDYFSKMIKSMNQSQPVSIFMGTEFPIRLEFAIAEGNGEGLYLLAPRVEED